MIELLQYQADYLSDIDRNIIMHADTGLGKTIMGLEYAKKIQQPVVVYAPASKVKEGGWQRTANEMGIDNINVISYNMMKDEHRQFKNHFAIFDEGHRIKNLGVWGRTANIIVKKFSDNFVLLTATPRSNGWVDCINYFKMFGIVKSKKEFQDRYNIMTNYRGFPEIVEWRNIDELEYYWSKISKRLRKEDCADLPDLIVKDVFLTACKKYHHIKRERIYNTIVYDNMMSWRHGLRANTSTDDKIEYILDYLHDASYQNVVIFYNYNSELVALKDAFKKYKLYECNGYIKNYPAESEWSNTQNTITLANYKSGSEGIEFTYADVLIFFSPSESYTDYVQAIGRLYRHKQERPVIVIRMITNDTIETSIYDALDQHRDFNFDWWLKNGK